MTPSTIGENELRAILDGLEGVTPGPWHMYGEPDVGMPAEPFSGSVGKGDMEPVYRSWQNLNHIARLDPDTVRSIVTELLDLRSAGLGTVSVKPLEWEDWVGRIASVSHRNPLNIPYKIYRDGEAFEPTWPESLGDMYPTMDAAKAAAQSDFETRVKSCLTSIGVEAGKWRVIDSAPKDGTWILARRGEFVPAVVKWLEHDEEARFTVDPETFMSNEAFDAYWHSVSYEPTHWQPLTGLSEASS